MADENVTAVAEVSTTPTSAEPAEASPAIEPTAPEAPVEEKSFDNGDPWADLGKEAGDKKETDDDKPAEAKPTEPAQTEEGKKDETKSEDDSLEELFKDADPEKSEDPTQEELDKMTPEELIERQKNKYAKDWAERNSKKAEIVKAFQADTPIAEVAQKLEEVSKERYTELSQFAAHQLVDTNPDATFRRAYAVKMLAKNPNWDPATATIPSLDDLIAGTAAAAPATKSDTPAVPPELATMTKELDESLEWDWRDPALDENFVDDREKAMAKSLRALEATAKNTSTESSELKAKLDKAEKDLEALTAGKTETENTVLQTKLHETITEYRTSISEKILPYIAKNTGLEPSKDDTPEITAFKANRMKLYTGTEYQKANGIDSDFETFAYNESSVKKQIEEVTTRIVDAQIKESQAKLANNTADAHKYHEEAEAEKLPMIQLLAQANKEFKEKFITPDMELIGKLSGKLAAPIKEAAARVEVVSNGGGSGTERPKEKDYQTADDVWNEMPKESEKDDALRANA